MTMMMAVEEVVEEAVEAAALVRPLYQVVEHLAELVPVERTASVNYTAEPAELVDTPVAETREMSCWQESPVARQKDDGTQAARDLC